MRFCRFSLGLSLLLALSACALTTTNENYTETVSSWRWGKLSQLLRVWGNPTHYSNLANGNRVYIYEKETFKTYPAPPATAAVNTIQVPMGKTFMVVPSPNTPSQGSAFMLTCTTSFEVDPRGVIVNVRAMGNDCTADDGFGMSKANPRPRERIYIRKSNE